MTQQRAGSAGPRPVPRGLRPCGAGRGLFLMAISLQRPVPGDHREASRPNPSFSSF